MLVVLAIVALLLSIAAPRYFGSVDKSREAVLRENLKVLRTTLDQFQADKGRFPDQLQELVDERYLRGVPVDPITESATSWILLTSPDAEVTGIADVKSGATGLSREGQAFSEW